MRIILFLWVVLGVLACNQEAEIPSYIQIDTFSINTNGTSQGSASHNIQDVWVYANGNLLGGFSLPATIPVLETGTVNLVIDPGVRDNGISARPRIYPYYTRFEASVELAMDEVTVVEPFGTYADFTEFVFIEDFEESNIFTEDRDEHSETTLQRTGTGGIEGNAGIMFLDTDYPEIEVATGFAYPDLPINGNTEVYLELDYKNEVDFALGVIGHNDLGTEVYYSHVLTSRDDWKKVYINLTEVLANSRLDFYQIAMVSVLPDGMNEATVLVDNIKLLHRN